MLDAALELLGLHRVGVFDILEHLGREGGQAAEVQLFAFGQCVANLEDAIVGQTYDVAGPSLVDGALALRHKLRGRGETNGLALAHVEIGGIADELAAAYLAEGDARAVVGVDVGGNLEDEARELLFVGIDHTLLGLGGARVGGYLDETIQEFLHTEIVKGRTEEDGGYAGSQIVIVVEGRIDAIHQFQVFAQLHSVLFAHVGFEFFAVNIYGHVLRHLLFVGGEEVELSFVYIIDSLESLSLIDGPGEGAHTDLQLFLQFVQQVEGVATLAVHLVDKYDDGRIAHAANVHQFARLGLHTLGTIHNDDGTIYGRERSEGVFGKILVTRGVEDVHLVAIVVKLHDGGGDGDTALFLDFHPVAGGCLLDFIVLDSSCHLYLSSEEEEFLGECGLTRVGVGDNGKGASSFDFGREHIR